MPDRFPIARLIGSSGSFDTLAAVIARREFPLMELSKITSFKLEPEALLATHRLLLTSTIEERRTLPGMDPDRVERSEEHTSELQSRPHLVCRLLLEKKKNQ